MKQDVEFEVAGKKLEGLIVKSDIPEPANILILGGGANIPHKEGYYPAWQEQLSAIGLNSMSFDFRGVGNSEGKLSKTNLETRLEDARAAMDVLKQKCSARRIYIAGISMGAPVAIKLANEIKADGVVLISPAAYSEEAHSKPFGPEFSQAIRQKGSWEGSPDFVELERFESKVLLAYGEQDDVIPTQILHRYAGITKSKGEVLAFSDAGHRFMRENDPVSQVARDELKTSLETMVSR